MLLDPTAIRLSDYFLLSDFMGCTSVYRWGMPNRFEDDAARLDQGLHLAGTLDVMINTLESPISTVYGYISPSLSRKIVKYQDPNKPSYHRWDKGAAADICVHRLDNNDVPPIRIAHRLETENILYSRLITYAESSIFCFAVRTGEPDEPRMALYENRYVGERKPEFIKYPDSAISRMIKLAQVELQYDWRGKGWPSYHLGGKRGYEHFRIGENLLLSDVLYIPEYVHKGVMNRPPDSSCFWHYARMVGNTIDAIYARFPEIKRISIVRGMDSHGGPVEKWISGFTFEMVPHGMVLSTDIHDFIRELGFDVRLRRMKSGIHRLKVTYDES